MKKLLFILFVSLISCSEDENPTPDVRQQSVGSYSFSGVLTSQADRNQTSSVVGTAGIVNSGSNALELTLTIDNETLTIYLTGITEASNGIVFNVQSFTQDSFDFSGMNTVTFEGLNYHGKYDSGSKQLNFTMLMVSGSESYEWEILATKK